MTRSERLIRKLSEGTTLADYLAAQAEAAEIVSVLDKKKATRRARSLPRRKAEAVVSRAEGERHGRFVEAVKERDRYACQLCDATKDEPLDPHHLELGPNKIKHEKLSNTLTAHRSCHEAAHRNEAAFVPAVKAWAAKHGYPLPNRKVYR